MAGISKKDIEKIFSQIDQNFEYVNEEERLYVLRKLEKKANTYNGDLVSEEQAINIAFEKIRYNVARIYSEGKSITTLVGIKKYITAIDNTLNFINNLQRNEKEIKMLKELITHIEIALNLDISFHTSLNTIYADCLQKERVYFNDVVTKYRGGMII